MVVVFLVALGLCLLTSVLFCYLMIKHSRKVNKLIRDYENNVTRNADDVLIALGIRTDRP